MSSCNFGWLCFLSLVLVLVNSCHTFSYFSLEVSVLLRGRHLCSFFMFLELCLPDVEDF